MAQQTIAIMGAGGFIGSKLVDYLGKHHELKVLPLARRDLDLCDCRAVDAMLAEKRPDYLVNCVAFLNADRCEKEPEQSYQVNFRAVANLADILTKHKNTKLIHFSSDFVFDGKTGGYDENAIPLPISYYGLHKYMADDAIARAGISTYILRIASVIGAGDGKRDLIKALLGRVAKGADKLSVVSEYQISTSTPKLFADVIARFAQVKPEYGIYNTVASGVTTWCDLAQTAFKALDVNVPFEGIMADAFPMPAARPPKSWLDTSKLKAVYPELPDWESAITAMTHDNRASYLAELNAKAA